MLSPSDITPKSGLPPVIDAHIRVLILGSFPGEASLAAARYYAHTVMEHGNVHDVCQII